jgi:hypothetical protein
MSEEYSISADTSTTKSEEDELREFQERERMRHCPLRIPRELHRQLETQTNPAWRRYEPNVFRGENVPRGLQIILDWEYEAERLIKGLRTIAWENTQYFSGNDDENDSPAQSAQALYAMARALVRLTEDFDELYDFAAATFPHDPVVQREVATVMSEQTAGKQKDCCQEPTATCAPEDPTPALQ